MGGGRHRGTLLPGDAQGASLGPCSPGGPSVAREACSWRQGHLSSCPTRLPTSTRRPSQAATCRRNPGQSVPPANPELMNLRNLLPLNGPFFGVLVRTRGIRAWQVGLLLPGGLSFHPGRNLNWPPGPPLSFPLCNNPLFLQEALSNPRLLRPAPGGQSPWGPRLPARGAQGCPLRSPSGQGGCIMGTGGGGRPWLGPMRQAWSAPP